MPAYRDNFIDMFEASKDWPGPIADLVGLADTWQATSVHSTAVLFFE